MAYSDTVKAFKDALNGYSEEENKLSELYKTALSRNEKAKNDGLTRLDTAYKSDRNEVFADNARAEQNAARVLNSRGLGFSGEMAQSKLNSNLSLSNRLGDLASENAKNKQDLINQHDRYAHELSVEEAEKRSTLNEGKSKLLADIAKAELESEQKEKELELGYAELEAEKELFKAELEAKYQNTQSNGSTGNTNGGINGSQTESDEVDDYFSPEIKPKDLANLMVQNATGGDYIKTERHAYLVNKYLLEATEKYNLSDSYMQELVFMLKAYGLKELSYSELRKTVITQDAQELYNHSYEKRYKEYVERGAKPFRARTYARGLAVTDTFDYIFSHTQSKEEFLEYCELIKLDSEAAKNYASNKVWSKKTDKSSPPKLQSATRLTK